MPLARPDRSWRSSVIEILARSADRLSRASPPTLPLDPGSVRRILVVKPCCLGDVLMTTPALRALKRHFAGAEVDVLTSDWCAAALRGNAHVDRTLPYPERASAPRLLALAGRLRQERYDVAVSLDRSPKVNGMLRLTGIAERVGIDSRGRGVGLTRRVSPRPLEHEIDLFLSVVALLGVPPAGSETEYAPSADARVLARRLLGGLARPVVVIHPGGAINPGSVMLSKRWPAIAFGELASRLVHEAGASVVLVGALSDRDAVQITADFTDAPILDLGGQLSIDELAAVAREADLYVGNDSGASHLANAVGTPTVTIFGPTSPYQYRPLGPAAQVVAPEASWDPALVGLDLRGKRPRVPSGADIRDVSVDDVLSACRGALAPARRAAT